MDNSAINSNALLNAAAVWFILKAIEVIVFVVYDVVVAIVRLMRNRADPDPDPHIDVPYDRSRGWLEYVFSGAGFLNVGLCRQRRTLLLLISTTLPIAVFALELMSIILGNETNTCKTSADPNIVSSPALVLYGEGSRHADLPTAAIQAGLGTPRAFIRPCVSWPSSYAGVECLSTLCAQIQSALDHASVIQVLALTSQSVGVFIPKRPDRVYPYALFVFSLQSKRSLLNSTSVGTLRFDSEVVVNGKNFLYQNVTYVNQVSEASKIQMIQDVRVVERAANRAQSEVFEDEEAFWFVWENVEEYLTGVNALVYAVLAQATRDPVKTAAKMSSLNSLDSPTIRVDISCENDFILPRTASIIIIVMAVISRLTPLFIPSSKSSVEFALE